MSAYLELKQQAEQLLKQAEAARQLEIAAAIGEIKVTMATFGLTLQDLRVAGIDPGKPAAKATDLPLPPKYRGPQGQLWSGGRGRKPDWAYEAISKDGPAGLEKYRIKP
jgi:DNA-binding protein H-NS